MSQEQGSTSGGVAMLPAEPTPLSKQQCRAVLEDFADIVHADSRASTPIYTDDVLFKMIPPFCGDIDPSVSIALFLLLAEERADAQRGNADYREVAIAESNADHYLTVLLGERP